MEMEGGRERRRKAGCCNAGKQVPQEKIGGERNGCGLCLPLLLLLLHLQPAQAGGGEEISQLKKEEEGKEENPFYTSHKNNQKCVIEVVGLDIFVQPDFIGVGSRWEEEEGGGRRGIEIRKEGRRRRTSPPSSHHHHTLFFQRFFLWNLLLLIRCLRRGRRRKKYRSHCPIPRFTSKGS